MDCTPNSGVTGGGGGWQGAGGQGGRGQSAPTSDREISADLPGKTRQGKRGKGVKIEKKSRKIIKGKVENWKWKVEKLQIEERTLFFYFIFILINVFIY